MPDDWRARMDAADEEAAKKADDAVKDELESITQQATDLETIFSKVELTDAALHAELVAAVEDATAKNESVANVITRLKGLGESGVKLATSIGDIASGGTLAALRTALKLGA